MNARMNFLAKIANFMYIFFARMIDQSFRIQKYLQFDFIEVSS